MICGHFLLLFAQSEVENLAATPQADGQIDFARCERTNGVSLVLNNVTAVIYGVLRLRIAFPFALRRFKSLSDPT